MFLIMINIQVNNVNKLQIEDEAENKSFIKKMC